MLDEAQRDQITAAVTDIVNDFGGSFDLARRTDLYLGRRTG